MAAQAIITQVNRCSETEITSPSPSTANAPKPKVHVKVQSKRFLDQLLCCFRAPKKLPGNNVLSISSSSAQWALLHEHLVIDEIPVNNADFVISIDIDGATHQEVKERPLLKPVQPDDVSRKCVVIDLDETLVHSSFMPVNNADFVISIDIDGATHQVYVSKRPHVDEFLEQMGQLFECVLFTASLGKYADPVTDLLDKTGAFQARLFRESCVFYEGNYVKDLSRLGRDLRNVVILDNSPTSYLFQPNNAVPILSWFDDQEDKKLLELLPFFEKLAKSENACEYLRQANSLDSSSNVQEVISLPT